MGFYLTSKEQKFYVDTAKENLKKAIRSLVWHEKLYKKLKSKESISIKELRKNL